MQSLVTGDGSYEFPVVFMCVRLRVSRSGFYGWRDRAMSATARRRADIGRFVKLSFVESDETYGYRRAGTAAILGATRVHATTIELARGALVLTTLPDGTHLAVLTIRE